MAGTFTPQFLNRLRERITLSELIGRSIKIQRAGREYKACCPFHKEKTPSFTINDQKGFYHCFGCGAHGDAVGFVMQYNNLSFPEAVSSLAAEAGLEVPKPNPQAAARYEQEKSLYSVMEAATKWFQEQLWNSGNKAALTYMLRRGFDEQTLHNFRIGFAPADWDSFVTALTGQGIKHEQLRELGLTKRSQRGGKDYAFFRGRVMFPVTDRRGRVVAFGGRHLAESFAPGDLNDGYEPAKYMNSPDNPLFHKGELLYNLARSQRAAGDNQPLIVVEGYTDAMRLQQAGVEGSVAPLGTALTEAQLQLLWRLQRSDALDAAPILCFDGDNAGRRAAWRALTRALPLLRAGRTLRFLFLPQGEDPDSLVRSGGAGAFRAVMAQAQSLLDVLWQQETTGRNLASPEERSSLARRLTGHAQEIKDLALRREVERHFKQLQYQTFRTVNVRTPEVTPQRSRLAQKATEQRWEILLTCLANHPWLLQQEWEWLGLQTMPNARFEDIKERLLGVVDALPRAAASESIEQALEGLDFPQQATYIHAAFARTDASRDEVTDGWRHICTFMQDQVQRSRASKTTGGGHES